MKNNKYKMNIQINTIDIFNLGSIEFINYVLTRRY